MADLITVREWLRLMLWLVGALLIGALLATWHLWRISYSGGDSAPWALSSAVSGALLLLWFGLLSFYLSARRMLRKGPPSRLAVFSYRTLWVLIFAVFIGVLGYGVKIHDEQKNDVFSLLRMGELAALETRLTANPALLDNLEQSTGETLLTAAYKAGDVEAVDLLLSHGCSQDQLFKGGRSPLVVSMGQMDMLRVLIENGVGPDLMGDDRVPPLHYAIVLQNREAVDLLLDAGADVDLRDARGRTALMRALELKDPGFEQLLIERGASVRVQDKRGDSPLHKAVRGNHPENVKLLLEHGADSHMFNYAGFSALHVAAITGNNDMVKVLLDHDAELISLCNQDDQSAFDYALRGRKYETATLLLKRGAQIDRIKADGQTALHVTIRARDYDAARFLIESGADVGISNGQGETARQLLQRSQAKDLLKLIPLSLDSGGVVSLAL